MKNRFYLLLFFLPVFLVPGQASAQTWLQKILSINRQAETINILTDTFTFRTIRNAPDSRPNLNILLDPAYLEFYGLNINMGYEASIHYSLHHKLNFWAAYKAAYIELVEKHKVEDNNSFGGPATGLNTLKNGEIGVEYIFKSKNDPYDEGIYMGRYNGVALMRNIGADYRVDYALRLSAQYFETYISGDQIPLSGYYVTDPSKHIYDLGNGPLGTIMQENIINVGFSAAGTHDLLVTNWKLGQRETQYKTLVYADIMVAPSIAYTNVIMKNKADLSRQEFTDFNINTATPKSRIGLRAGFTYYDLSPIGITFSLEGGLRPGPDVASGLYLMGKFGLALNAKI